MDYVCANCGRTHSTTSPGFEGLTHPACGGEWTKKENWTAGEPVPLPEDGFVKHDQGKARYDLFYWPFFEQVAAVLEHGADKYGAHNWQKGTNWGRYIAATIRHITAFAMGEEVDKDSGLSHLAHAACNCMIMFGMAKMKRGTDDRFKTGDDK